MDDKAQVYEKGKKETTPFYNHTLLRRLPRLNLTQWSSTMAPVRPNPTLSDDLISEILVRVPVKSLGQFQSVSKTWLSLIKHPAFVKSQLRHALATQNHVVSPNIIIKHDTFSLLDVDSRQVVGHLKFPCPRGEVSSVSIVGSANGIVCVAVQFKADFPIRRTDIHLWNPAIRQSKLIPSLFDDASVDIICLRALGFGYDGVDRDFKVVSSVVLYPPHPCYAVFSDNRNAWRVISLPEPMCTGGFDVCINGFLCGIEKNYAITAFDLNQEALNCDIKLPVMDDAHAQHLRNCAIKLPVMNDAHGNYENDNGHADGDITRLIEFNNSIAVIMLIDSNKKINFWTLDDVTCLRGGGVEASWTPVLSIVLDIPASLIHGYFSNGNLQLVVLIGDVVNDVKMLISCNVDKKEAEIVPLPVDMADDLYSRVSYKYTESLVSLVGFTDMLSRNMGEYDRKAALILVSFSWLMMALSFVLLF